MIDDGWISELFCPHQIDEPTPPKPLDSLLQEVASIWKVMEIVHQNPEVDFDEEGTAKNYRGMRLSFDRCATRCLAYGEELKFSRFHPLLACR